jgi:hypothetical protein
MRILTYASPFEIDHNKELWDIVTKYPHYCASDTLVQGLEAEYGRERFGILRPLQALIDSVLSDYTKNPPADIQLFLTVSNIIRGLPDTDVKTAFRFNIAYVVEAVRMLALMECDTAKFIDDLPDEQKILLDIYDQTVQRGCQATLEGCKKLDKAAFIQRARATINSEIEYMCNAHPEYRKLDFPWPLRTARDGHIAITKIVQHLRDKIQEEPEDIFAPSYIGAELRQAELVLKLLGSDDALFDRIVVHGVHNITPVMYFLFKQLERMDVEVIFLINYAGNLPNVYRTWKEVYAWCDTRFEYTDDLDMSSGRELGRAVAAVIEGQRPLVRRLTDKLTVYRHLTSFTDREVRLKFKKAEQRLNDMETQYYAVRGESSNEILKLYFPEHFQQKPFLSYPIGQFILGIYRMWDFEKKTLVLSESSLSECAVSSLFKGSGRTNMLETIRKLRLYFSDIETAADYYMRIGQLKSALREIGEQNDYAPLGKLSFFSVTSSELTDFKAFLEFLDYIAGRLFSNGSANVDFGKHFKMLMEIISVPAGGGVLSSPERLLVKEISEKLASVAEGQVQGHIEDVREALSFYLTGSKKSDSSNWIVRDFEQIDGAVLMRRRSKASRYHFALLSNAHMTTQRDDALPWPLTEDMFMGYADAASAVPVVTKGLLERRNFLKFSLFYGVIFTKCGVELSYIKEENGEEQTPYYLLNVLGFEPVEFKEEVIESFRLDDNNEEIRPFTDDDNNAETKEMFSICPYKYLQHAVIKAPVEYHSDYHVKYYVANFIAAWIGSKHIDDNGTLHREVADSIAKAKKLFPFWNEAVFLDIRNDTLKQLERASTMPFDARYKRRKQNFLIAQWTDKKIGTTYMDFNKPGLTDKIKDYLTSVQIYPHRDDLPHKKVCEDCNFGEVCLRDYYEARTSPEEGGNI